MTDRWSIDLCWRAILVVCLVVASACKRAELSITPEENVPKIVSFSPTSGTVGTAVTITGENFGSSKDSVQVKFGSVVAEVDSVSPTRLVVSVPDSAVTAPINLTLRDTTVSSSESFTVVPSVVPSPFNFQHVVIEVSGANAIAMHDDWSPDTTYLRQLQLNYTIDDTLKYRYPQGSATCTSSSQGDTFKITCRSTDHLAATANATDALSGWVSIDTINRQFRSLSFQHIYDEVDLQRSFDDILRLDTLVGAMIPYTVDSRGNFVGEIRGSAFPTAVSLFRHMEWKGWYPNGVRSTRYADTVRSLLPTGDNGYIRITLKR